MSDPQDELRDAFEEAGYEVAAVSTNRDRIRIALTEERAEADRLSEVVYDIVGEDGAFGLDVTTENVEGGDAVRTVVSFRHRA